MKNSKREEQKKKERERERKDEQARKERRRKWDIEYEKQEKKRIEKKQEKKRELRKIYCEPPLVKKKQIPKIYSSVDDKKIVYTITRHDFNNWFLVFVFGSFPIGIVITSRLKTFEDFILNFFQKDYLISFVFIVFLFLVFYQLIFIFTHPKREKILDRENELFTIHSRQWYSNTTDFFYNFIFMGANSMQGDIGSLVCYPKNKPFVNIGGPYEVTMSFFVWYMDKNRPLPLGDAFDEYRQRDYERRKAEGFPKPLFPSDIPTPEATPEQQKERKKVGGW